ncbi:uncharacterized protein KGF55_005805 [Candida pseudojiufengensis]|uniref:uncharacterized protein n=1 Tax=Candida pseudojiufengensis TaxID=497109 RepID=UPI002224C8ED|nr:uncharacterized protein KGF55_005805 [Candida pseudojiufengensis]KAI5958462.1 hypothetical protein KGF55_005805 [Candida pseudojiufengensis]
MPKRKKVKRNKPEVVFQNYFNHNTLKIEDVPKENELFMDSSNVITQKIIALKAPNDVKLVYSGSKTDVKLDQIKEVINQPVDFFPEFISRAEEVELSYYRINKTMTSQEIRNEFEQSKSCDQPILQEFKSILHIDQSSLVFEESVNTNLRITDSEMTGIRYETEGVVEQQSVIREECDFGSYFCSHFKCIESRNMSFMKAPRDNVLVSNDDVFDCRILEISKTISL